MRELGDQAGGMIDQSVPEACGRTGEMLKPDKGLRTGARVMNVHARPTRG